MAKKPTATPEYLLQQHASEVQAVAKLLRAIIQRTVPEAVEKVYLGWHGIGYTHPKAGYFCCIFPMDTRVRLAFEHGASLDDPAGLLQLPPTSSKQVRYVELFPEQDIAEQAIVTLLQAAIQLKS